MDFSIGMSTTTAQIRQIYAKLQITIWSFAACTRYVFRRVRSFSSSQTKDVMFVSFYASLFSERNIKDHQNAKAVIMAYEGTRLAENFAAQAIFGGIGTKGKLPVLSADFILPAPTVHWKTRPAITNRKRWDWMLRAWTGLTTSYVKASMRMLIPGCQVLVAKDGMIVYNKSFGMHEYGADAAAVIRNWFTTSPPARKLQAHWFPSWRATTANSLRWTARSPNSFCNWKVPTNRISTIRNCCSISPDWRRASHSIPMPSTKSSYTGKPISPVKDELHPVQGSDDDAYVQTGFTSICRNTYRQSRSPDLPREVSP